MNKIKCTCIWWVAEPIYDPSCEILKHAELAFEQNGWVML